MKRSFYQPPLTDAVRITPFSIWCGSASKDKCPKCGSRVFKEKEVLDNSGRVIGWILAAVMTVINPSHGAHAVHHAIDNKPTKTIRICKKCGEQWEV